MAEEVRSPVEVVSRAFHTGYERGAFHTGYERGYEESASPGSHRCECAGCKLALIERAREAWKNYSWKNPAYARLAEAEVDPSPEAREARLEAREVEVTAREVAVTIRESEAEQARAIRAEAEAEVEAEAEAEARAVYSHGPEFIDGCPCGTCEKERVSRGWTTLESKRIRQGTRDGLEAGEGGSRTRASATPDEAGDEPRLPQVHAADETARA